MIQYRASHVIYIHLNIVGEQKAFQHCSVMSTLRPVGTVALENSRGQTAPKNRLAKESGTKHSRNLSL